MFPIKHATDLSYVQLWLLHWVQVYDWAFSLPEDEKPTELVIEDDDRFDQWYKVYVAQKMSEARKSTSPSRGSKSTQHDNVIKF